jgi:lipopolysaccharide/colanic/teichoic acid biosynthesis glycosyltransferase
MVKRIFDDLVAAAGLILALPILLAAALAIKLDSPGPVVYRARRVGKDGVLFDMYKLRTMVSDADRTGPALTSGQDPRVTRSGRILRQWKIDELPQLVNVLRGEMSLVGPRPESPDYARYYTADQRRVLTVRPGITGPAQIRYRHEETVLGQCANPEQEYVARVMQQKLAIDLDYVRHRSFGGDVMLLVQTVAAVARPPA